MVSRPDTTGSFAKGLRVSRRLHGTQSKPTDMEGSLPRPAFRGILRRQFREDLETSLKGLHEIGGRFFNGPALRDATGDFATVRDVPAVLARLDVGGEDAPGRSAPYRPPGRLPHREHSCGHRTAAPRCRPKTRGVHVSIGRRRKLPRGFRRPWRQDPAHARPPCEPPRRGFPRFGITGLPLPARTGLVGHDTPFRVSAVGGA